MGVQHLMGLERSSRDLAHAGGSYHLGVYKYCTLDFWVTQNIVQGKQDREKFVVYQ